MNAKPVFDIILDDFDSQVIEASYQTPVLVDFWADWCSPCIVIAPILTSVVEEYEGQVKLAKLEVDEGENMKLAGKYQVRGFPTIILFRNGEEKARFSSAQSASYIREFIDNNID
ncbi:MAG: thioredoxin domain-containing protein [Gammaproteobacteria bacterium]|jgi:putative thioredoxin